MPHAQHAVELKNAQGRRLVGIVHEPSLPWRRDLVAVLLSPGVKNRIAPHRLYNKLAGKLVEMGFVVGRFDFSGLGDSEGRIEESQLAGVYTAIQLGCFVQDTRDILDWLERRYPAKGFLLLGLCGGAITGLLAATDDDRVKGIVALGIPAQLDVAGRDAREFMTSGQLGGLRAAYLKKALNPRMWGRLLRLETDFGLLARSFAARIRPRTAPPGDGVVDNTNPRFGPALTQFVTSRRPILLVFSGQDRLRWEFEEKFVSKHPDVLRQPGAAAEVAVIEEANHILTFSEWQQTFFSMTSDWIERQFPCGRPTR